MKKIVAFLLMVCLLMTMITPVFANQLVDVQTFQQSDYNRKAAALTSTESDSIEKYKDINISDCGVKFNNVSLQTEKDRLLSFCSELSCQMVGNSNVLFRYDAHQLGKLITECDKFIEAFQVNGFLYIRYIAKDGKEVMMSYSDAGLYDICVYDETTDVAFYMSEDKKLKYSNYREGIHYEITSEKLDMIHSYLDNGTYDELSQVEGISVTPVEGGYVIEEEFPGKLYVVELNEALYKTNAAWNIKSSAPLTDNELYSSLIDAFPMINNRTENFATTPLSKVTYSRNNYIKLTANWKPFMKGETLTAIGLALGIAGEDWVGLLLNVLGIAYSGNKLLENARLCNSATYEFTARKTGFVYDNTLYNDYVYVVQYSDRIGTFAGGFTSHGEFQWIYLAQSPTWNRTNETVSATAVENYNWDVALNGYCSAYNPNGFW